ncbi:MAG TPA: hypothetical protein DEH78_13870 [Solibacterales bacterium]|nr:hypothetical protein [Bryobacterales bacterium]
MAPELNVSVLTPPPAPALAFRTRLVRWLFRIHRWTGLVAGIPIAVILVSGTVVVFKDEIDEFANPRLLVVQPARSRVPIDQALASVLPVQSITLPVEPHRPYLAYRRSSNGGNEQVAIDPYRGTVLGARPANGHLADILRQLHVRFYFFGATGRIVVGALGLILCLSGITGLILYPRFLRGQSWRSIRMRRGAQWANSDIHKLAGIVTLAVNLLWALTGAVLGLENLAAYYRPAQKYLHPQPTVRASTSPSRVTLENALATAAHAIDGFTPRSLSFPSRAGQPVVVHGNVHGAWSAPASSWVALDPATGAVLETHDERAAHLATQIYNLHDPLHFGYFGGAATRWLWFVAGAFVSVLPITGYAVWWLKRRGPKGQFRCCDSPAIRGRATIATPSRHL